MGAYTSKRREIHAVTDKLLAIVNEIRDEYDVCIYMGKFQGLGAMVHDLQAMEQELEMLMSLIHRAKKVIL